MRKWYAVVMSVLTLALAAALVLQAVDIYADGNAPGNVLGDGVYAEQVYRAEDIRARLEPLALPAAAFRAAPDIFFSSAMRSPTSSFVKPQTCCAQAIRREGSSCLAWTARA